MSKLLLKEYVRLILEQEPEAPVDAPFGQYLFADPKKKIRRDEVEEADTDLEEKFLSALRSLYDYNDKNPIISLIRTNLNDLKEKGFYRDYLQPPNQTVYRGITVDLITAANILNVSLDELNKIEEGIEVVYNKPGILNIKEEDNKWGNEIMSWSLKKSVASNGLRFMFNNKVGLLFVANPNESSNNFFLNPRNILKKFDPSKISPKGYLAREMEVISFGPVNYKKVFVVRGTLDPDVMPF